MAVTQLSRGMAGNAVIQLQSDLLALGFRLPSYGADGKYGSETEKAVRDFQYTYGIGVDGIVGPITAAAIKEAISLLNQGQWNPSADPLEAPASVSTAIVNTAPPVIYSTAPTTAVATEWPSETRYAQRYAAQPPAVAQAGMIQLPFIGNIPWTWIALGGLGLLIFLFFFRGKGGGGYSRGRRRRIRRNEPEEN